MYKKQNERNKIRSFNTDTDVKKSCSQSRKDFYPYPQPFHMCCLSLSEHQSHCPERDGHSLSTLSLLDNPRRWPQQGTFMEGGRPPWCDPQTEDVADRPKTKPDQVSTLEPHFSHNIGTCLAIIVNEKQKQCRHSRVLALMVHCWLLPVFEDCFL